MDELPEVLVRSVMSLYEGVNTIVLVDYDVSLEFEVKVKMFQGSVLFCFFCSCGRCCQ